MNQKRLRQMYGSTPPDFEQRVRAALSAEVPRTRRCVVPRRAALIAALALLLAGAAAVAAFHSQVAAYFGWFYGDEARQRLETGGAYVPEETLYTPDAAYTMEEIVRTDEKGRYSYNDSHTLIRANQGHSVPVDVELQKTAPPEVLWHGTGEKYTASIEETGLIPKSRLYVHLSRDTETATAVGRRHGKPVIYQVESGLMSREGYDFFLSANGVWLTKAVPPRFLKRISG